MTLSLAKCQAMLPLDMAKASAIVQDSYHYLLETAEKIEKEYLRQRVVEVLHNPAPSFLSALDERDKASIRMMLINKKLIEEGVSTALLFPPCENPQIAPQPFWCAPGSSYFRHHAYPGGLAVHTALNLSISLSFCDGYKKIYHCLPDRDLVVAGQILHDFQKPWVLQWCPDGSCTPQPVLAGTAMHHIFGLAEAMFRGFEPEIVIAQACAHLPPGTAPSVKQIALWLAIACHIAGKEPAAYGVGKKGLLRLLPPVEWFIVYQGDQNWVVSMQAATQVIAAMQRYAREVYGMEESELNTWKFNALRNYVFSQVTVLKLYEIISGKGYGEFQRYVQILD